MRKKRFMIVVLALMLILPAFLVDANQSTSTSVEKVVAEKAEGELASKDEVVYANLHANGELHEIYVVNILEVIKAGTILDYGKYSSVTNLTDLSEIEQVDGTVLIDAPEGKYYYQGNMKESGQLPWDIKVSYLLDGTVLSPEELAGKDGHVEINIFTSANENADRVFFENYLLQVSLTLDPDIFRNIETNDGMTVNVGKNKQITFSVMPDRDAKLIIQADAVDFELQGIEIAAIPMSMSIDTPDIDEMTEDMKTLTSAIKELNEGVGKLNDGVTELNDGVTSLRNGSKQYQDGMTSISDASGELVDASDAINEALATISHSLTNSEGMDLTELKNLPGGLSQIANGLNETANGLSTLRENYTVVYQTLDSAIMAIPQYQITEQDIHGLYQSGANKVVVDQLVETYTAALTARATYSAVKEGFDAVHVTLQKVSGAINEMGGSLTSIANGLSSSLENMDDENSFAQLQEGLETLAINYREFHAGLVSYTGGVGQLSNSYNELHAGIIELSGGTAELEDGVGELYDGTNELYDATKDLPDQMQEEIDSMIAEYDRSDFEAVSFVSSENEKINSVQFVIKTESIKKVELETSKIEVVEEKGFWARLVQLFSRG
ncbi:YhgE/Pip domain-containing protein [Anaerobacillus alkaliphilus]|nr:YhgE/Pip domain-containing protein [Anaerobacillus alkaliphilus]